MKDRYLKYDEIVKMLADGYGIAVQTTHVLHGTKWSKRTYFSLYKDGNYGGAVHLKTYEKLTLKKQ
jgi:hypothetical protein